MPKSVVWFEILSYLGVLLQAIAAALVYPEASRQLGEGIAFAICTIVISISVFLIWSAARRRKNWARWVLLVCFGLGLLFAVPSLADDFKSNVALGTFNAIMLLLDGAAVYLLFSPGAQPWFAKVAKPEKKSAEGGERSQEQLRQLLNIARDELPPSAPSTPTKPPSVQGNEQGHPTDLLRQVAGVLLTVLMVAHWIAPHIDRKFWDWLVVPYTLAWVIVVCLGAVLLVKMVIADNAKHAALRALRSQSKRDDP